MSDCPHCDSKLAQIGKTVKKKNDIKRLQKRYRGEIDTIAYGFSIGKYEAPEGSMRVDTCKFCGWQSVWVKDGQRYQYGKNLDKVSGKTWKLLDCGTNVDVRHYLVKYGFKKVK